MLRPWRTGIVIFAAITAFSAFAPAMSAGVALDREIKGTFLYKFAPFVTWPESAFAAANAPLIICIVGDQGLADSLQGAVAGQHDGNHPLVIRAVSRATADCQVLYVPGQDASSAAAATAAAKGRPVLTVTDIPLDAAGHGVICFVMDQGHVRFDIDNAAASENGLVLSSKLLGLARAVKTKGASP